MQTFIRKQINISFNMNRFAYLQPTNPLRNTSKSLWCARDPQISDIDNFALSPEKTKSLVCGDGQLVIWQQGTFTNFASR